MSTDKPTVLQFHWQHRVHLCRTVLVEQSPLLHSITEALAWVESLSRYRDQCPDADHVAMVCDRGSDRFIHGIKVPA